MPRKKEEEKLSERQKRFAEEILNGKSGKDAATLAGYSPTSARSQASRLLTNRNIQNHLYVMSQQMEQSAVANAEEALTIVSELLRDSRLKPSDRIKSANLIIRVAGGTSPATDGEAPEEEEESETRFFIPFNFRDDVEIGAIQFNGRMLTDPENEENTVTYLPSTDILRYEIWKETDRKVDIMQLSGPERSEQISKFLMQKEKKTNEQ